MLTLCEHCLHSGRVRLLTQHLPCLIHCRRYFVNALPKEKKAHPSSVAAEAVRYFDRIYHEEGLLVNMTADERYKERLVKIKPLLDELFARLETVQVSGKSALAKAVRYALHEKPFFYTFLQNGNVLPDNNRAENAIRPFAIGRKNWLFSNTANGAKDYIGECKVFMHVSSGMYTSEKFPTDATAEDYLRSKPDCSFSIYLPPDKLSAGNAKTALDRFQADLYEKDFSKISGGVDMITDAETYQNCNSYDGPNGSIYDRNGLDFVGGFEVPDN